MHVKLLAVAFTVVSSLFVTGQRSAIAVETKVAVTRAEFRCGNTCVARCSFNDHDPVILCFTERVIEARIGGDGLTFIVIDTAHAHCCSARRHIRRHGE